MARRIPQQRSRGPARGSDSRNPATVTARQAWAAGRFDESLKHFSEAVRQAPADARLLIEASRAHGKRYRIGRALELLERALRHGLRQYAIQHAAGETYRALGRIEQAEECYRRACRLAAHPKSQYDLALICERRHRLDEADELAQQALAQDASLSAARILVARIARRRGDDNQAEAVLRGLTSGRAPAAVVAEAWGELATLLDGRGDYDAAWHAAEECKQVLLPIGKAEWEVASFVLGRCRRMVDAVTREHFDRWTRIDADVSPQPVALLTGFPRSGTTLLERVLDAHPNVVSTEERDLFATVIFPQLGQGYPPDAPIEVILDELADENINASRDLYKLAVEAMLGESIGPRLHIDKNPSMTLMIPAMRRLFPELKTIFALRDPRDVVLSCYLRYLPINPVSVCFLTLERTVERYLLDVGAWLKFRELMPTGWVEVRYEDVVRDLPQTATNVLRSLQLPWNDAVLDYRAVGGRRPVLSPSYEAVAKPISPTAVGRWRHYARHLAPLLERLAPITSALGYED